MTADKLAHSTIPGKPLDRIISRRGFLKVAGLATLSAVAACRAGRQLSPPPAATPYKKPDVEIMLTAGQAEWELAPGKGVQAWTYNGTVPGEAIRVREGDRVRVTLQNELREPTTIH